MDKTSNETWNEEYNLVARRVSVRVAAWDVRGVKETICSTGDGIMGAFVSAEA